MLTPLRNGLAAILAWALAAAPLSASAEPALWAIRDKDSTIYVFGTMHVAKPGWRSAKIDEAFARSGELIVEALPPDSPAESQALLQRLGLQTDGGLSTKLTEQDRARLAARSQSLGVSPAALERMRPWLAAVSLGSAAAVRAGWDPANGDDAWFLSTARAAGKRVSALETAELQLRMLADVPEEVQLAALSRTLEQLDQATDQVSATYEAWLSGDVERLRVEAAKARVGRDAVVDEKVRTSRNRTWADALVRKLGDDGVTFVAVGAGHLVGSDGVLELLSRRGIQIERQ